MTRLLLAWLVALTASHALTWSGETHMGHGRSAASLELHLSAASFDHGHGDCGLVRVDAALLPNAVIVRPALGDLERRVFRAERLALFLSEFWPDSHAPPV